MVKVKCHRVPMVQVQCQSEAVIANQVGTPAWSKYNAYEPDPKLVPTGAKANLVPVTTTDDCTLETVALTAPL